MKRFGRFFKLLAIAFLVLVLPLISVGTAKADTLPPSGTPSTVSADPLPTVQIDGIVWDEAIYNNTVYATGHFNYARPAGAAAGTQQTVRTNLLAFDITTGQLITSFNHTLTATDGTNTKSNTAGQALSVSPDGKRLYVGGTFQKVDGKYHSNFAAFDLTQPGAPVIASNFVGANGAVRALAATNGGVFIGGSFSKIYGQSISDYQTRTNLAAFTSSGLINPNWKPTATLSNGQQATVRAILPLPTKVVIGGSFDRLNGSAYYGSGAVDRTYGYKNLPWASQSSSYSIRYWTKDGSVTSLTTDASQSQIYLSGQAYHDTTTGIVGGTFEGRAAISPTNGSVIWQNDCYGDTYDAIPIGQVLYSVGHAHDCSALYGPYSTGFPESDTRPPYHALAETTYKTGTNNHPTTNHGYGDYAGMPDSTQLDWYPSLNLGTVSGQSQAAWAITGNSSYITLGGEFTVAGNTKQQGLVRYAIASKAPNKVGPVPYTGAALSSSVADGNGNITIAINTTYDLDNAILRYHLYRNGVSTPICELSFDTRAWSEPVFTCGDGGFAPGATASYYVVVTDPYNNQINVPGPSAVSRQQHTQQTKPKAQPAGSVAVDDDSTAIVYTGSWVNSLKRGRGDLNDGVHFTQKDGDSATFTFSGSAFSLLTETSNLRGNMAISIDGGPAVTVNAYTKAPATSQVKIFSKSGLSGATHTVKITKLSGSYMVIDGFVIGH